MEEKHSQGNPEAHGGWSYLWVLQHIVHCLFKIFQVEFSWLLGQILILIISQGQCGKPMIGQQAGSVLKKTSCVSMYVNDPWKGVFS